MAIGSREAETQSPVPVHVPRPSTLTAYAESEIHRGILAGRYPGGSALRIADLAKDFGISTMPIREALQRLAGIGLVEIIPHKGARVVELSVEDLQDTYATRIQLEAIAISDAARRFTPLDAQRAQRALKTHVGQLAAGDVDAARIAHREFHFAIYEACGSKWLVRSIEPTWRNSERYRFAMISDASRQAESDREHEELLRTCMDHSPAAAEHALKAHLQSAFDRIRDAMLRDKVLSG